MMSCYAWIQGWDSQTWTLLWAAAIFMRHSCALVLSVALISLSCLSRSCSCRWASCSSCRACTASLSRAVILWLYCLFRAWASLPEKQQRIDLQNAVRNLYLKKERALNSYLFWPTLWWVLPLCGWWQKAPWSSAVPGGVPILKYLQNFSDFLAAMIPRYWSWLQSDMIICNIRCKYFNTELSEMPIYSKR